MRRLRLRHVNRVGCHARFLPGPERLAGVWIRLETRCVRRAYRDANAVTFVEDQGRTPQINGQPISLAGLKKFFLLKGAAITSAKNTVGPEQRTAVRTDSA